MGAPSFTPFGVAAQIGSPAPDNVPIEFGDSSDASMFYDGSDLVINPKEAGSGILYIGESSSNADGDIVTGKIGISNSPINPNAYVNGEITGDGRQILNFVLTFNGSGTSAGTIVSSFMDQGTSANFVAVGLQSSVELLTTNHSNSYQQQAIRADGGVDPSITWSSGSYRFRTLFVQPVSNGIGGTHTGGTVDLCGIFQQLVPDFVGVSSQVICGYYGRNDLVLETGVKLILEGSVSAGAITKGDTYFVYTSADSALDSYVNNTEIMRLSSSGLSLRTVGTGLILATGTNATFGRATLAAGTVTVNTTKVTANSNIFLTPQDSALSATYRVSARTAGSSFTITSSNAGDTNAVAWIIIEPA